MSTRERLDLILVKRGLFESRAKAQRAIMAGLVVVDNRQAQKPGQQIAATADIEVKSPRHPYVSRGGLKLDKALDEFKIDVKGSVAIDIGASTGGFTDCLIKRGARRVYAIDVGYGQLAWKLRRDSRVVVMERRNIRYVEETELLEKAELITIDVSFISLSKVLPVAMKLLSSKPESAIIALVKPQFELEKCKVGKGGIVKSAELHKEAIQKVINSVYALGLKLAGVNYSPILGAQGNMEFFVYLIKCDKPGLQADVEPAIEEKVEEAHKIGLSSH